MGRRTIDIREQRSGWRIFRDGCSNGESPFAFGERIDRLIARLRTMDGDVALFSHGQFGARWIGLPVFDAQHFEIGPASMSGFGTAITSKFPSSSSGTPASAQTRRRFRSAEAAAGRRARGGSGRSLD